MTRKEQSSDQPSRRTFLKSVGVTGLLGGASDTVAAQERSLQFNCAMAGWKARAPPTIEGRTNPTLELEAGVTYEIEWANTDGFRHNFVIADQDGNQIIRTGYVEEAGKTQIVKFTATEQMTRYFCEVHPATMRGEIDIAGREEEPTPYEQEPVIPPGDSIGLVKVADGLNAPLGFEIAPGVEDRQFVLDQPGQIYVLQDDGLRERPFLDISGRIVDLGVDELQGYDERGLLGLAFHPNFQENQRFFVRYSSTRREGTPKNYDHTEVLSEFEATADLERGNTDSERTLLEIPSPQMNHNAAETAFGPDGFLYMGIGDGGGAGDTAASGASPTTTGHADDWYAANAGGNGQDVTENLLGSILRIDINSQADDKPYDIPEDNPLVGREGLDEHYAWGFRNPRSLSFDSEGRLFVSDAGQNRFESVYLVENGGNYGWNVKEGTHCFSTQRPSAPREETGPCPDSAPDDVRGGEELRDPIIQYPHRYRTTAFVDGSVAIGGHVYESDAIDHLQGKYVLGNWSGRGVLDPDGEIFAATEPDGGGDSGGNGAANDSELWPLEELVIEKSPNGKLNRYVYAFGQDHDGELYVVTNTEYRPTREGTGQVYKLVAPGEGEQITDPDPQPDPGSTETPQNGSGENEPGDVGR